MATSTAPPPSSSKGAVTGPGADELSALLGSFLASPRHRQPYPLVLRVPDTWWSCGNCGKAFDEGQEEALVISGREGHSELRETITYCFDCLELLGEVVGEGPQKR